MSYSYLFGNMIILIKCQSMSNVTFYTSNCIKGSSLEVVDPDGYFGKHNKRKSFLGSNIVTARKV